jgi:hypothetical protein
MSNVEQIKNQCIENVYEIIKNGKLKSQHIKIEEKENGQHTLTNLDTYDSKTIKVLRVV